MSNLEVKMPPQYKHLFEKKWRHIVYHGGRGGAKSYNIALALLLRGMEEKHIILCTRETQNSINDSVHSLLKSLIEKYEMTQYEVLKTEIRNRDNGTQFLFKGLRKESIDSLKSMPNTTLAWVEEAHSVSSESIDKLVPTVREEGSQIIWSFNREVEQDPVWVKIVESADEKTFVMKINSYDVDGFLSDTLKDEREKMKADNFDLYRHVWLGEPLTIATGSVFGQQIERAKSDNRVTSVPYDASVGVYPVFDLGISDSMAIWFYQMVGLEVHFIDYYENSGEGLGHYIEWCRSRGYNFATWFLPHDAKARELQSGKSREEFFHDNGIMNTEILPPNRGDTGIELARGMFSRCYFDKDKCQRGLECLNAYHYAFDERNNMLKRTPEHDWSSHGADAFIYACMSIEAAQAATRVRFKTYTPKAFRA
jgi:phage terminase large subunit